MEPKLFYIDCVALIWDARLQFSRCRIKNTLSQVDGSAPRLRIELLTNTVGGALCGSPPASSSRSGYARAHRRRVGPITRLRTVEGERNPLGGKLGRREEGFIAQMGVSFGGPTLLVSQHLANEE